MFKSFRRGKQYLLACGCFILLIALYSFIVAPPRFVHATPILRVDSTGDAGDATPGDGICDDGTGACTLRAAIEEANASAGADTIDFNITGAGVHTIQPATPLPTITDQVTIDGFSQPGTSPNHAVSPNPLNGTLLIQIDGENAASSIDGLNFAAGSDHSIVRGLVVNNFGDSAIRINGVTAVSILGNYIGTDPTGQISRPNGLPTGSGSGAISTGSATALDPTTTNTVIGGSIPDDRNLISGNNYSGIAMGGNDSVFEGNYVGIAADGLTPLKNSRSSGDFSGGITIDYADGAIIGGTSVGAMNVFSGNDNSGISAGHCQNLTFQGNYFGLGYDGHTAVPNDTGLTLGNDTNVLVGGTNAAARNVFSGNVHNGIGVENNSSDVTVQGNYIGTDKTGLLPIGNQDGISVVDSTRVIIGGATSGARNVVANNTEANLFLTFNDQLTGATDSKISGNYIGTNVNGVIDNSFTNGTGILVYGPSNNNIIGGATTGEGNRIAGNKGGILAANYTLTPFSTTFATANNAILGNAIYSNSSTPSLPNFSTGIGIDLFSATENDFPPDGIDSTVNSGQNINAPAGNVPGQANDYINHPVINTASYISSAAAVNFNLNVAGSTSGLYRVEFFASDSNTPGQGQQYLGSTTVAPGTNLDSGALSLPAGYSMSGKFITATATELNDPATNQGFGSTSEFSDPVLARFTPTIPAATTPTAPNTGSQPASMPLELLATLAGIGMLIALGIWNRRQPLRNR